MIERIEMISAEELAIIALNPRSGECFGIYKAIEQAEYVEMLDAGTHFQVQPWSCAQAVFGERMAAFIVEYWGEQIGQYRGKNIPAWIETGEGKRLMFQGVASWSGYPDLRSLKAGQLLVPPGLIYA